LLQGLELKYDLDVTVFYYKEEFDQIRGSIQARGVIYTLLQLSNEQKRKGVIAISTGYFAEALCYYGTILGIPVTVVMPSSTVYKIVNKCRFYSATVMTGGDNMVDAHRIALHTARTRGLVYLDGYVFFNISTKK